ncbi:MAG: serine/threonine-protein phosphatase [Blautia sp.]|nr:serine/threonine-protein phosphatase [Blautia sp.]
MKIREGGKSDVGSVRLVNQDAICCRHFEQGKEMIALCAVCDGVGGLEHGEVASAFLTECMEEWFDELVSWLVIVRVDPEVLFSHLKDAAENWNEELYRFCQRQNVKTGSTMSLLLLVRQQYYIIHVGDSRVYRYRGGTLEQLTMDDSVTRLRMGRMKSYLDNYVGKREQLRFQALKGSVETGDVFVVCSDGFSHHLTELDLEGIHERHWKKNLNGFCGNMIRIMMERGERDNISVCVAVVEH